MRAIVRISKGGAKSFIVLLSSGRRQANHTSARTEMEETYDLYTYLPEMREAIEKWKTFVKAICIDVPVALAA